MDNERLEERSTTRPGLFYSILVYKKGGCDHLCCANINFKLNPNKYNHLSRCCVTCEMFEKIFNGGRRVIDMWSAGYGMLGDKKGVVLVNGGGLEDRVERYARWGMFNQAGGCQGC